MKFTRYEIQAFTLIQVGELSEDGDDKYGWVPVPKRLMFDSQDERDRIEKLRDEDGRFQDLYAASAVYRQLKIERPGATLRLRKIVIQEVYTTLDGTDSDDEARVRKDRKQHDELVAELYPGLPAPMV